MIIKTVQLTKQIQGKEVYRYWDYVKTNQGYAVQRNGKTVCGRLSSYGGMQIFTDYVTTDLERGWIEEDEYNHPQQDVIVNNPTY